MTQDERWMIHYNEVKEFIEREHRNPSKYRLEEPDLLNWVKANRKRYREIDCASRGTAIEQGISCCFIQPRSLLHTLMTPRGLFRFSFRPKDEIGRC